MPPLCAIVLPTFTDSKNYRIGHFWLTVLYTFLNFSHPIADLRLNPIQWYQIALMAIMCLIGILLNLVAYQWTIHYRRDKQTEHLSAGHSHHVG